MRIVVLGKTGQLGQELARVLPGEVISLGRADLDLCQPGAAQCLAAIQPAFVFNTAAYNLVDRAEEEPAEAVRVNALGVRELAQVCARLGATLVHFSTNYVFGQDHSRSSPYVEADYPGPTCAYGGAKLLGEQYVAAYCPNHFIVRTCGLFSQYSAGGKGTNFAALMLRKAREGAALRVVNDQTCAPTWAADLAEACAGLLLCTRYGLYHATSAGQCTWHEFASEVFRLARVSANLTAVGSVEFGARAIRPGYGVLSCEKWRGAGLRPLLHWRDGLAAYLAGPQPP